MGCRFILLRHGQTYWNAAGKFQGQVNIPLNETGREQAKQSAEELRSMPFDKAICSPLSRARETGEIVLASHGIGLEDEPLLLERNYGIYEGDSFLLAFANPGHELYQIKTPEVFVDKVLTLESYPEILARADRIRDEIMIPIAQEHTCVLMVGHCDIFCALLSRIFDIPLRDYWRQSLPNAGYAILDYEDESFVRQA